MNGLHVVLARLELLLVFKLRKLKDLVPSDLVLELTLFDIGLLLCLELSQTLCRLLLVLLNILQSSLQIVHFLSCQVYFDRLDFLIDRLLVMLSPGLNLLLEYLLRSLLHLLEVLVQVLIQHPSVEIVQNPQLNGTNGLQSVTLCLLLFHV